MVLNDVIMTAPTIIMYNNLFAFGNTYWLQLIDTAMGTSPAPDYASLFLAVREAFCFTMFLQVEYYLCYINTIFSTLKTLPNHSPSEDYTQ